ncbi:hypothetical protein D3C87_770330 [compost metagenome]
MYLVDDEEWLIEHQLSRIDGDWILSFSKEELKPILDWCKAQHAIDPGFRWLYKRDKDQVPQIKVIATDLGLKETYSIKTSIIGSFFYFKREQDFMLFKLAWA